MNDALTTTPKPVLVRRRRFQFSLRTLFVLMTLIAVAGGWFAMKLTAARKQAAAVEALIALGATVCYDYEMEANSGRIRFDHDYGGPGSASNPAPNVRVRPPSSPLLREWLGVDFFHRVVGVEIDRAKDGEAIARHVGQLDDVLEIHWQSYLYRIYNSNHDADASESTGVHLRELRGLPKLKSLVARGCKVTADDDLAPLARLPNLEEVTIEFWKRESGRVVKALSGAKKLSRLKLEFIDVEDGDFEGIHDLPELRKVQIVGNVRNAAALGGLRALPALEDVEVSGSFGGGDFSAEQKANPGSLRTLKRLSFDHGDLAALTVGTTPIGWQGDVTFARQLTGLEELHLKSDIRRIDDAGMREISQLSNLRALTLKNTRITSAGMAAIVKLSKLEILDLSESYRIDDRAVEHLRQLRSLRELSIPRTQITNPGRAQLHQAIPGLRMERDPPRAVTIESPQ